jgi:hypothetical protein
MCIKSYILKLVELNIRLLKKIDNLLSLLADKLRIDEVIADEVPERCPCCGYTPCDCDDH